MYGVRLAAVVRVAAVVEAERHRWGDAVVSILGVAVVGVMGRLFVSG